MSQLIQRYNDTWNSGSPIDLIVFGGGQTSDVPKIKYTLPNGDRITTTMSDYNKYMPFVFKNEGRWRNYSNLLKRQKLGLTEDELGEIHKFEELRKEYLEDLKKGIKT